MIGVKTALYSEYILFKFIYIYIYYVFFLSKNGIILSDNRYNHNKIKTHAVNGLKVIAVT